MNFKTNATKLIALMLLLCTAVLMFSSCAGEKIDRRSETQRLGQWTYVLWFA